LQNIYQQKTCACYHCGKRLSSKSCIGNFIRIYTEKLDVYILQFKKLIHPPTDNIFVAPTIYKSRVDGNVEYPASSVSTLMIDLNKSHKKMVRNLIVNVVCLGMTGHTKPHWFLQLCVLYPAVKQLTVNCLSPTAVSLFCSVVNTCVNLKSLCITIPVKIQDLSSLTCCRRITKLIIKGKQVSWKQISHFVKLFPNLDQLVLRAQLSGASPPVHVVSPRLQTLCFGKQPYMTHVPDLSGLPHLNRVCLSNCVRLNNADALLCCNQLSYLNITNCYSLSGTLLNQVVRTQGALRSLYFNQPLTCQLMEGSSQTQVLVTGSCMDIPIQLLASSVAQLGQLEHLEIQHGCKLGHLRSLLCITNTKLRVLYVYKCKRMLEHLYFLSVFFQHSQIEFLYLDHCHDALAYTRFINQLEYYKRVLVKVQIRVSITNDCICLQHTVKSSI
jgi:hypothetical protein